MSILGSIIGGAAQIATAGINNAMAAERAAQDRAENYRYGEMAANNADTRTRALYNDFYSPAALLRQYNEAGLSPSMMYGGTPGQGGMSGAQGHGTSGIQTPYMPMSIVEAAQAANLFAQTEKTKAETKNVEQDTVLKALEADYNTWRNYMQNNEMELVNYEPINEEGKTTSLFDMARNAKSYENFIEEVKNSIKKHGHEQLLVYANTDAGRKQLNRIYMASNMFERDIAVLSEEGVSAKFQQSIIQAMQKEGFAEQNAETAVKTLKAAAETAELTTQQKEAWNNLLERIGKKSETARDILIILGMFVNNAATNWKLPSKKTTNTTTNVFTK